MVTAFSILLTARRAEGDPAAIQVLRRDRRRQSDNLTRVLKRLQELAEQHASPLDLVRAIRSVEGVGAAGNELSQLQKKQLLNLERDVSRIGEGSLTDLLQAWLRRRDALTWGSGLHGPETTMNSGPFLFRLAISSSNFATPYSTGMRRSSSQCLKLLLARTTKRLACAKVRRSCWNRADGSSFLSRGSVSPAAFSSASDYD